ncbi:hypothetical protein D3C76_1691830 [compost metagenome]
MVVAAGIFRLDPGGPLCNRLPVYYAVFGYDHGYRIIRGQRSQDYQPECGGSDPVQERSRFGDDGQVGE